MASVNKAIIVGNLGKDQELRHMPNGDAVVNFSVATTENYKDRDGNKQEKTEWHNVVIYGKLAEIAAQYLKKGSTVYLEGRIQTRKWQKDGVDRYTTEIIANSMTMLGGKDGGERPAQQQASQQRRAPAPAKPLPEAFDDSGIPF